MPTKKPIQYNGKSYQSIRQLYNELTPPFSYVTFTARLSKYGLVDKALAAPEPLSSEAKVRLKDVPVAGYDENDIAVPSNFIQNSRWRHQRGIAVSLWGKTYQSIAVVCQLFGVSSGVVYDYMTREQTDDLALAIQHAMSLGVDIQGVHYPSINAAAVEYGQNYLIAINRIHNGWTLIDALTKPLTKETAGKPITVYGQTYDSFRKACEAEKISVCRLPKRDIPLDKYLEILVRVRELYITDDMTLPGRVPYLIVDDEVFRTRNDVVRELLTSSESHLKRKADYHFDNLPDMIRYLHTSGYTKKEVAYVYSPLEYRRYLIGKFDEGCTDIELIPIPDCLKIYVDWFVQKHPDVKLHAIQNNNNGGN